MAVGLSIAFEAEIPGIDPSTVSVTALGNARQDLDDIAVELDERTLGEFVSFSVSEAEALAGDLNVETQAMGSERWFSALEGLKLMRALASYLRTNPEELDLSAAVVSELEGLTTVLERAAASGVGFHFRPSY